MTSDLTRQVEEAFYVRCPPEERPTFLYEEEEKPVTEDGYLTGQSSGATMAPQVDGKEKGATEATDQDANTLSGKHAKYDSSMVKALHKVFFVQFWSAGLLKLISGMFRRSATLC